MEYGTIIKKYNSSGMCWLAIENFETNIQHFGPAIDQWSVSILRTIFGILSAFLLQLLCLSPSYSFILQLLLMWFFKIELIYDSMLPYQRIFKNHKLFVSLYSVVEERVTTLHARGLTFSHSGWRAKWRHRRYHKNWQSELQKNTCEIFFLVVSDWETCNWTKISAFKDVLKVCNCKCRTVTRKTIFTQHLFLNKRTKNWRTNDVI